MMKTNIQNIVKLKINEKYFLFNTNFIFDPFC